MPAEVLRQEWGEFHGVADVRTLAEGEPMPRMLFLVYDLVVERHEVRAIVASTKLDGRSRVEI